MLGLQYRVVRRDTLWDIAGRTYGDPTLWPVIYRYNNLPEVVRLTGRSIDDEDLIYPDQILYLPPIQGKGGVPVYPERKPEPPAFAALVASSKRPPLPPYPLPKPPQESAATRLKAKDVLVEQTAYAFELEQFPAVVVQVRAAGQMFRAMIKMSGKVTLQKIGAAPLVTVSNKGYEILARQQAASKLADLVTNHKIEPDFKNGRFSYSCNLTQKMKYGECGEVSSQFEAGVGSSGVPQIKGVFSFSTPAERQPIDAFWCIAPEIGVEVSFDAEILRGTGDVNQKVSVEDSTEFYPSYLTGGWKRNDKNAAPYPIVNSPSSGGIGGNGIISREMMITGVIIGLVIFVPIAISGSPAIAFVSVLIGGPVAASAT